jgi:hypothetical protein
MAWTRMLMSQRIGTKKATKHQRANLSFSPKNEHDHNPPDGAIPRILSEYLLKGQLSGVQAVGP